MVFHILLWVGILVTLVVPVVSAIRGSGDPFAWFFGTALAWVIMSFIVIVTLLSNNSHTIRVEDTETTRINLKALGNASEVHGSFFLGSGYIGQEPVLQYITEVGGGMRLESMPAAQGKIFEDSTEPHLMVIKTSRFMEWVVPWEISSQMHYDFHVPKGSVLQSYKIDVTK